jgi:hypothetical protein
VSKTINIYQVESTSKCSATCSFCPHPTMERTKTHMTLETFAAVLAAMRNDYMALHHFGEPLLNPLLPDMIKMVNAAGKRCEFSTNGKGLRDDDNEFLKAVMHARPYLIRIAYDFFQPDAFIRKVLTYNQSTIIKLHAVTPGLLPETKPLNNWAGQMPWESQVKGKCYFLDYDYHAVLQDGRVVRCCQDFEGKHIQGHINDPGSVQEGPISLCDTCSGMQFADDGLWKQEKGEVQS